jgi:curved DNA-binding protein CbpA
VDYEKAIRIMGVPINYTKEDLKKQYRKLAKKAHPDLNGGSHDKFVELRKAFEYLELNEGNQVAVHTRSRKPKMYHGSWIFEYEVR